MDNLNTHQSETLVRIVAQMEGVKEEELGVKGKSGVLKSMKTRSAFLHDLSHKNCLLLHSKTCFMDQSNRNISQYFSTQITQKGEFSFRS